MDSINQKYDKIYRDNLYWNVNKITTNKELLNNKIDLSSRKGYFTVRDKEYISELLEELCEAVSQIEDMSKL